MRRLAPTLLLLVLVGCPEQPEAESPEPQKEEVEQTEASKLDELISELEDPDPDVRRQAAQDLGKLGKKAEPAVPALKDLWNDRSSAPNPVREAAAQAVIRINPQDQDALARAWGVVAMERLYQQRWAAAIEPLERALKLAPKFVECWNNLGKAHLELKQLPQAEQALLAGLEAAKTNPSRAVKYIHNNLGLVYLTFALQTAARTRRAEHLEKARQQLARAVRDNPSYEVALLNLAHTRLELMNLTTGVERRRHADAVLDTLKRAEHLAAQRNQSPHMEQQRWFVLALVASGSVDEGLAQLKLQHLAADERRWQRRLAIDAGEIALRLDRAKARRADEHLAWATEILDLELLRQGKAASGDLLITRGLVADARRDPSGAARFLKAGLKRNPSHPQADRIRARLAQLREELQGKTR